MSKPNKKVNLEAVSPFIDEKVERLRLIAAARKSLLSAIKARQEIAFFEASDADQVTIKLILNDLIFDAFQDLRINYSDRDILNIWGFIYRSMGVPKDTARTLFQDGFRLVLKNSVDDDKWTNILLIWFEKHSSGIRDKHGATRVETLDSTIKAMLATHGEYSEWSAEAASCLSAILIPWPKKEQIEVLRNNILAFPLVQFKEVCWRIELKVEEVIGKLKMSSDWYALPEKAIPLVLPTDPQDLSDQSIIVAEAFAEDAMEEISGLSKWKV